MKKLLFVLIFSLCTTAIAWSQAMSPHAIGLKTGGGVGSFIGLGAELSYQRALSATNRAEFNLGISSRSESNRYSFEGFYHWVRNIQGGLNSYIGPGAGIGYATRNNNSDKFFLGVAGQVGLEYRFMIPLQLTLDVSPYVGLINSEGFAMPVQLGVRYLF